MTDMSREQLWREFYRQVKLCSGIGREGMRALLEDFFVTGDQTDGGRDYSRADVVRESIESGEVTADDVSEAGAGQLIDLDARRKGAFQAVEDQILANARGSIDQILALQKKLDRAFAGVVQLKPNEVVVAKACTSYMLSKVTQAEAETG